MLFVQFFSKKKVNSCEDWVLIELASRYIFMIRSAEQVFLFYFFNPKVKSVLGCSKFTTT
jgi:hypothetical protein